MKEYIVDANILFSALISGKSFYKTLFAKHLLYTPDFALREMHHYQELLVHKMKGNEDRFRQFAKFLFSNLTFMPEFIISLDSLQKEYRLCKHQDEYDTTYVALSIELGIPFVTRDKPIYHGLKQQGFDNVILFQDLVAESI